jgi:hypothetical protein
MRPCASVAGRVLFDVQDNATKESAIWAKHGLCHII